MTVSELILELTNCDPEFEVVIEDSSCFIESINQVEEDEDNSKVYITTKKT